MVYNNFKDLKLSALGMGTMRFPVIDGKYSNIDEEAVFEMVDYAMANGINYYDTAWGYHDGMSEIVTGKALRRHPRDSYYIATKFPGYDLSVMDKVEEIFEKQLEKTGMEYFDFYLVHNVFELNIDHYLDPKYGIVEYLLKQKEAGRIRYLGFSAHGSYDVVKRYLEAYGDKMEFCQIQLNWLDYDFLNAKARIELLNQYNIPVWVMEPLRGGKLVNIADTYKEQLQALRPEASVHEWAFRFLQTLPEVAVSLSGMSNMEQLKDNIKIYETHQPLNETEMETLRAIGKDMMKDVVFPCTSCRYCTTHCPMELDIPKLIAMYSEHLGGGGIPTYYFRNAKDAKSPKDCIGCGACEAVCPQIIKIPEIMAAFAKVLN